MADQYNNYNSRNDRRSPGYQDQRYGTNRGNDTSNRPGNTSGNAVLDLAGQDPIELGEKLISSLNPNTMFTTSQLRKILSAAAVIRNRVDRELADSDTLSQDIQSDVQYLRLRLVYQMGRESSVKASFSGTNGILDMPSIIKNIGSSKKKFDDFYRLLESIVAYRKFKGDRS